MKGLLAALGRFKRWRAALLWCVAIAAALCGAYIGARYLGVSPPFIGAGGGGAATGPLPETERLVPVRRDSLQSSVSINGSVVFANDKTLVFGSKGFIDEVLVTEGELVAEGQPLVKLDPESAGQLLRAVAQEQVNYEDALDALASARSPALEIANAEKAIADAAQRREDAQQAFDALLAPAPDAVAKLESALADADLELQNAREELETLLAPEPQAVRAAEEAVAQAEVTLKDRERAVRVSYGDAEADLRTAEQELAAAMQRLDAAQNTSELKKPRDAFAEELIDYRNVVKKWTGVAITDEEAKLVPSELFSALGFDPSQAYDKNYALFPDGVIADNPATRWNELVVFAWRGLYPGSSLIELRCDESTLAPRRTSDTSNTNAELCMNRDMDNAWEAVHTARGELESAESNHEQGVSDANAAVLRAVKARDDAAQKLDDLSDGSIDDRLILTRRDAAVASLDKAERDLRDLLNPDEIEAASKRERVELAQANRDKAAQDLDKLLNPTAATVSAAHAELAAARAQIADARAALRRIHSRRALNIALQEAAVASARANVEGATRRYEDSTLKAPFDGFVADVKVEAGKEVEPFEQIVQVINTGRIRIEGGVDEIDVLSLRRGAPAIVTLYALPDQEFDGVITSISSTGSNDQGVVTFDVKVELSAPEDITLQSGLTGVARVASGEESGILAPDPAILYYPDGIPYVRMMEDGVVVEREITLGNGDGFWTIVESGLEEGEEVIVPIELGGQFDVGFGGPGPRGRRGPPPDDEFDDF